MSKVTIWLCCLVCVAVLLGGVFIGRATKQAKTEVITQERIVHDTTVVYKTLKGKTVVMTKRDTVVITTENQETIASYESIIESLAAQLGNKEPGESKETVVKVRPKFGMGITGGVLYDDKVSPIVQVPIRYKNLYLVPGCGWSERIVPDKYSLSVGLGF